MTIYIFYQLVIYWTPYALHSIKMEQITQKKLEHFYTIFLKSILQYASTLLCSSVGSATASHFEYPGYETSGVYEEWWIILQLNHPRVEQHAAHW